MTKPQLSDLRNVVTDLQYAYRVLYALPDIGEKARYVALDFAAKLEQDMHRLSGMILEYELPKTRGGK
jgi:hypothetical protein